MASDSFSVVTVLLGNTNPQMQEQQEDGTMTSVSAPHLNQSVTRIEFPDPNDDNVYDATLDEDFAERTLSTNNDRVLTMIARALSTENRKYAPAINEIEQILALHAGGDAPAWVRSEDPALAAAIAEFYGCPVGEPMALLTNLGRDVLHAQHMSTSAQPASCNYMSVSANATAPSAATTTLPGEITTPGGGLIRKQATYAHTGGTNVTTLTATFTANGTDALPVVIAKIGIHNHLTTAATCDYETLLNATATLNISGDNVAITETVTGG